MPMTCMPMCAEQYSPGPDGPHVSDLELTEEVPGLRVGEEHPAGLVCSCRVPGRRAKSSSAEQPLPKDSSTEFTTVPSLLNIAEWKKSTAPGMFPVPPS